MNEKHECEFRKEVEKTFDLAQLLDSMNPTLKGAFIGTPSERIERQLKDLGILK